MTFSSSNDAEQIATVTANSNGTYGVGARTAQVASAQAAQLGRAHAAVAQVAVVRYAPVGVPTQLP